MKLTCFIESLVILLLLVSCNHDQKLEYALKASGPNRHELERVLDYYKGDSLKFTAACFLIENMPGHCSYLGDEINDYYSEALFGIQEYYRRLSILYT